MGLSPSLAHADRNAARDISHEELRTRLCDVTERCLGRIDRIARYLGVDLYDVYKRADGILGPPPWLARKGTQSDE